MAIARHSPPPPAAARSTAAARKALTAMAVVITIILPLLAIAARTGLLSRRRLRRSRTWVDEEAGRAAWEYGHFEASARDTGPRPTPKETRTMPINETTTFAMDGTGGSRTSNDEGRTVGYENVPDDEDQVRDLPPIELDDKD